MPVGKPKIEVDVAHRYDSLMVLDHIQFDVYENEFLCILGPERMRENNHGQSYCRPPETQCGVREIGWRACQSSKT